MRRLIFLEKRQVTLARRVLGDMGSIDRSMLAGLFLLWFNCNQDTLKLISAESNVKARHFGHSRCKKHALNFIQAQ